MRVQIRDQVYDSIYAAAEAHGVSPTTVTSMICTGRADHIGIGRGNHRNHVSAKSKPFSLGGYSWPSRRAAAIELGISPKTFQCLVRQGHIEKIMSLVIQYQSKSHRTKSSQTNE